MQTRIRQDQIRKSNQPGDSLPLPEYSDLKTLEDDLNYIRSVIRDFKGTQSYDSPVLDHLEEVQARLELILTDANLVGVSLSGATSQTPAFGDNSDAIATTEFVQTAINASTELGDLNYVHSIGLPVEEIHIQHDMGKRPSVTFMDTSFRECEVGVVHHSLNDLTIYFDPPSNGTVTLN